MLKFLGRGSAFNVKEGNTSAYIKKDDSLLLIDCGSTVFKSIIEKNILDGVKNVYVAITHMHPDHVGSLGDLIFYCYYVLKIEVKIYMHTVKLRNYLKEIGITPDKYDYFGILDSPFNVLEVKTKHCEILEDEQNIFECFSLLIFRDGKKAFYSGDCYTIDFWDKIENYDQFYIDACIANYEGNVHYNIEKLYQDCKTYDIDVSKVWCMHFDNDKCIDRAKELGFNVVEVE